MTEQPVIFLGSGLKVWAYGFGITLLVFLIMNLICSRFKSKIAELPEGADTAHDILQGVLGRTRWYFLLAVSLYFGSLPLKLPDRLFGGLQHFIYLILLLQVGIWGNWAITRWSENTFQKKMETDAAKASAVGILRLIFIIVLWVILVLAALGDLGFDITTLIAGLGVGGIAIALASQKILGDLFASLTIILDKPFVVGDFITMGELSGTVENIGLKTTRIRGMSGEQWVLPNSDMLESRIQNFRAMNQRRAVLQIGVTYQTPLEKLKKIPEIIRGIIEQDSTLVLDRVHFKDYGPYSLNFEAVYYFHNRNFLEYLDHKQAINLSLYEQFEKENIEFAYPTQTLFMEQNSRSEEDPPA